MKVVLVEPNSGENQRSGLTLTLANKSEPIGLCYVGSVSKQNGYEILIIQQNFQSNMDVLDKIKNFDPDVVDLTCMNYRYCNVKLLAGKVRKLIAEGDGSQSWIGVDTVSGIQTEALEALITLGINKVAAEKTISVILKKNPGITVEELIKLSLKS